jgi:predicted HTH transcriptional regulator
VIREAIVNAVAHRDYTSNGSVQVMVFADRVEI